jgi:glucose uptake protein GlcU
MDFSEDTKRKLPIIVGYIIAIIFLIVGIYMIYMKKSQNKETTATISHAQCVQVQSGSTTAYNCLLSLNYSANGTQYQTTIKTENGPNYTPGQTINIVYQESNPTSIQIKTTKSRNVGLIFVCIAIIIFIASGYYSAK